MSQETQSIKFPPHQQYTDDKTPIAEWTIADTLESRHDQTWMLLSENQCQSIADQLEHYRRRIEDILSTSGNPNQIQITGQRGTADS